MRRLWYFPLEPYPERYTVQLSKAEDGWLERNWREHGVDYRRIEGSSLNKEITVGSVLDACGRGYWALSQVQEALRLLNDGEISSNDVFYFDDFWHPGIEALQYAFDLMHVHPRMYAMLHAQSVDIHDFTYPMRHWMRHFELGNAKCLSGIFVTSTCLRDLCVYAGIGDEDTVHLTGLPYNSKEVMTHVDTRAVRPTKRKKQVIWSSRWDKEKDPGFFLNVIGEIVSSRGRDDIKFVITTSASQMRSNNPRLLYLLDTALKVYGKDVIDVRVGQTKEQYYENLLESSVQFNCAHQDFVSWTLLEATTMGCIPVYPYWLSFPEVLKFSTLMYPKGDVYGAANRIIQWIDKRDARPEDFTVDTFRWVYEPFDRSWERMLQVMRHDDDRLVPDYDPLFTGEPGVGFL